MRSSFLYVSDGKLFKLEKGSSREIRSSVLDSYVNKIRESASRTEWKRSGEGARFMGSHTIGEDAESRIASIRSNICCLGEHNRELIYSININGMTGIYSKSDENSQGEGIVISSAESSYRDFDISDGRMALSSAFAGESHIGVLKIGESNCEIYTDGRSWDTEPIWSRTDKNKIYFCTAGLAIRQDGEEYHGAERGDPYQRMIMDVVESSAVPVKGPTSICLIDLSYGTMDELLSDEKYDFLHPQCTNDGSLYYIKRPYRSKDAGRSPLGCLTDILLLPFRLIVALFGFFNFFSIKYSGKALSKSRDVKDPDAEKIFIDGNLINANKELKENAAKGDKNPGIIPRSWELHKLSADGSDSLIRRGVVAYRVDEKSGDLLFSNGSSIICRRADGTEEKVCGAPRVTYIY